jgi:short-subunit dehydrogenase
MHDGWADDKVVLVTGAARGIGEMTARRLHARGAKLALVGLEPDRLSALADELGEERAAYLLNVASLAAASHAPLMTSYAASKAGVEGLSNSLRGELATRGVGVGCAYFGFIDTDMVRDAFAHPSTTAMLGLLPSFVRHPVPVDRAVDVIERGIRGRRARVWAPDAARIRGCDCRFRLCRLGHGNRAEALWKRRFRGPGERR